MSNMMHVILYAIVPIIVVMLAGYISGKRGAFTGEDAKKFNKVVLVYALPAALLMTDSPSPAMEYQPEPRPLQESVPTPLAAPTHEAPASMHSASLQNPDSPFQAMHS